MQIVETEMGANLIVLSPPKDNIIPKVNAKAYITIYIHPGAIRRSTDAIQELVNKGYMVVIKSIVIVHSQYMSEIAGTKGTTICSMQFKLVINFTLPPTNCNPKRIGIKTRIVIIIIAGPKEACIKAKVCLRYLVIYHHHEITHPVLIRQEVNAPPNFSIAC